MICGKIKGLNRPVPRVIFGTLLLSKTDDAFALLDSVIDTDCYAFDTAVTYGDGASERVMGNWMEARGNRADVIIIGKGAHHAGETNRVDPENIRQDLTGSLERLKTDYIDLFLLHRDDTSVPVGPIVEVLNALKDEGRIGAFGMSNWTCDRIREADLYAREHGLSSAVAASCQYSLAVQYGDPYPGTVSLRGTADDGQRDWYTSTQFPMLAWSSLARGFFSGKFARDNLETFTDGQDLICTRCYAREDNFTRLDRTRQLAGEKGTTLPQIAMAWVLRQPVNTFAITGAMNIDHLKQNVEAMEIDLTDEEAAWLDLKTDCPDQGRTEDRDNLT
jgi:aryl-alcohol dehydrogenase-like predicted oxidoreductase